MNDQPNTATTPDALPAGTRVLNTGDGEPGTVLSAYGRDPATGGWSEYEVVTRYGIELWMRDAFVLFEELTAAE